MAISPSDLSVKEIAVCSTVVHSQVSEPAISSCFKRVENFGSPSSLEDRIVEDFVFQTNINNSTEAAHVEGVQLPVHHAVFKVTAKEGHIDFN